MTKQIILFLPLLFLGTFSFAQFEVGLKAGLATESLQNERFDLSREGREDLMFAIENANYGFQFGGFFRIPLSDRFGIQPEVTFNSAKTTFSFTDPDGGIDQAFEERYNDINVPILASWKLAFLRLNVGPVGHFFVSNTSDLTDADGIDRTFETFNLGYALGGAIDIGPLTFDLRYDGNFSKYGETFTIGGEDVAVDQAPRRWIGTVGYRF